MKRLEIQNLRGGEVSIEKTAATTEVSASTVKRVSKEDPITAPEAADKQRRASLGRPSSLSPHVNLIERWLEQDPEIKSVAILERLREEVDYRGGKSAVYTLAKKLRPAKTKQGTIRFEAVPGEFSQHDFGQVQVRYTDGTTERVHFFASSLKYSRMRRIFLTPDERQESVCHALVDAFAYFGGVPLIAVFDNPTTMVTSHKDKHVKWNTTFAQFCVEAGFSPHACWPHRPQEKGQVENLVGFSKTNFFKVHTFVDRADMEHKLDHWHERINDERASRATGEIPRTRMLLEAGRLRPLGISSEGYCLRYTRVIRTDGFVEFDGKRYFASLSRVGQTVSVMVSREHVTIELGESLGAVEHPRDPQNGKYSILPIQRGEQHTKAGARPFAKRQLLMDLCEAAHWVITEIRHKRPSQWEAEIDSIYQLLEEYGDSRMAQAMIDVAKAGLVGSEYLKAILLGQAQEQQEVAQ